MRYRPLSLTLLIVSIVLTLVTWVWAIQAFEIWYRIKDYKYFEHRWWGLHKAPVVLYLPGVAHVAFPIIYPRPEKPKAPYWTDEDISRAKREARTSDERYWAAKMEVDKLLWESYKKGYYGPFYYYPWPLILYICLDASMLCTWTTWGVLKIKCRHKKCPS